MIAALRSICVVYKQLEYPFTTRGVQDTFQSPIGRKNLTSTEYFSQPLRLALLLSLCGLDPGQKYSPRVTIQDCLDLFFSTSCPKMLPWRHWQSVLFPSLPCCSAYFSIFY